MSLIWDTWLKLADAEPERRIVHEPSSGWTSVGELHRMAIATAEHWRDRELRKGRILLLRMPNGAEWMAAFLAAQKLEICVAAADYATPDAVLERMAADIGAAWICTNGGLNKCEGRACILRKPLCIGKISSGSTGRPKALLFGAEEMLADGHAIIESMGIGPYDVNYALIPLGHSYGLGNLVMPLIMQGSAIVCSSGPLPRLAARDMAENDVTVCPAVPNFFRALAQTELEERALGNLRLAISAGSALPPQVAQGFHARYGVLIHNFLGSSETGGIAYDVDGLSSMNGSDVGNLMLGVATAQGRDGRLLVAGPAVIRHGNRRRLGGQAAFLLGDRGEMNDGGKLCLHGRATALAKIGGRRVDPLEVERAIASLSDVSAVFVRVRQSSIGDRLVALVECPMEGRELRQRIQENGLLPEWKIPRKIVCMPHIERDERGKIGHRRVDEILY
ncbi:MAG: class I adenylate-forming enzyme family protein [Opitutales bacterium]|jgi:acyl-coenzyme A synthetase/AMP-(fatty) acid ligase